MTSAGKYYISILTEYEKEIKNKEIQHVVGLDFAMDGLFVDSETGKKANYPRFYRQMLGKLATEQQKLSRKRLFKLEQAAHSSSQTTRESGEPT